jgi:hypothetical protein
MRRLESEWMKERQIVDESMGVSGLENGNELTRV